MAENPRDTDDRLRTLYLILFTIGWIAVVAGLALFMRFWVPNVDIEAELAAIEEADTVEVDLEEPTATLRPAGESPPDASISGSTYVPLYDELYVGGERGVKGLSATLSMRNLSSSEGLFINSISIFDDAGQLVGKPLGSPHVLAPMASAQMYVDPSYAPGKRLAAVVVEWNAAENASPLIGALIVGTYGAKTVSFTFRGENRP